MSNTNLLMTFNPNTRSQIFAKEAAAGQQTADIVRQNQLTAALKDLFTQGQPTATELEQTVGQISPQAAVAGFTQPRLEQERLVQREELQTINNIFTSLVKQGATNALEPVLNAYAETNPRVAKVVEGLSGKTIDIADKKFQLTTQQKGGQTIRVRVSPITGEVKTIMDEGKPVVAPSTPFSKRKTQAVIDLRTNKILSPQEILDTPHQFQGVANTRLDQQTGNVIIESMAAKLTLENKAALDIQVSKDKQNIKEDIKDVEETEDVREKFGRLAGIMFRTKKILDQLPSGFQGGPQVAIDKFLARAGIERAGVAETTRLAGAYEAIKGQIGNLARELGSERGVLTDADVKRAFGFLPSYWQSKGEQEGAFQEVQNQLNESIKQNGIKNKIPNFENFYINFTGDPGEFRKPTTIGRFKVKVE